MSFNKLMYDSCSYRSQLAQEIGTYAYVSDPIKYDHPHKRAISFGIVAGNDVSVVGGGQIVDVESDLRGQTRLSSKCPTLYYQNPCPNGNMNTCQPKQIVIRGNPSNVGRVIDTTLYHLPSGQLARYVPTLIDPYMLNKQCK